MNMVDHDALRWPCGCVTMMRTRGPETRLILRPCHINQPCRTQETIDEDSFHLRAPLVIEHG